MLSTASMPEIAATRQRRQVRAGAMQGGSSQRPSSRRRGQH